MHSHKAKKLFNPDPLCPPPSESAHGLQRKPSNFIKRRRVNIEGLFFAFVMADFALLVSFYDISF